MNAIVDKLVDDVSATVVETCARCSEIHSLRTVENEYQRGYNAAAHDIAKAIRDISDLNRAISDHRIKKGKV